MAISLKQLVAITVGGLLLFAGVAVGGHFFLSAGTSLIQFPRSPTPITEMSQDGLPEAAGTKFSSGITAQTSSASTTSGNDYRNSTYRFDLYFPVSWTIKAGNAGAEFSVLAGGTPGKGPGGSITINIVPLSATRFSGRESEVPDIYKNVYSKDTIAMQAGTSLDSQITMFAGVRADYEKFDIPADRSDPNSPKTQVIAYTFAHDNDLYIVSAAAPQDISPSDSTLLRNSLRSFYFIGTVGQPSN
jgi:hypothetical protein